MLILQVINVSKTYGVDTILNNICLQVHKKEKIGIVGANGAGKSTLLKVIAGLLTPDSGAIQVSKGGRLAYLAQDGGLDSDKTIFNEMLTVYHKLLAQERALRQLESNMQNLAEHSPDWEKTMADYAQLQETFERAGGHRIEANIRNVLTGLGLAELDWQKMIVANCSGGQKTRIALAKILLSEPDILMLDEPTNYLDLDALVWLEQFIINYPGALIVVSHDRYFLDGFVTSIFEIDQNQGQMYTGNYSRYLEQRAQKRLEQQQQYEQQQAEIARTEDFIQRNLARASTTNRAQSRRKQLEKIVLVQAPAIDKKTIFRFKAAQRSGNIVLEIDKLSAGFQKDGAYHELFCNINLLIERGERIGIIGPNGTGKSTMLKIIADKLAARTGKIRFGSHVDVGYYDQEQAELDYKKTAFQQVHDSFPKLTITEVRDALAQFLFTGDDVEKPIHSLSGGERARIVLTELMLGQDNLLLLDEPTNHLDIPARETLERALTDFEGSLLFVSHDRYFLNRIATRIIYMTKSGLRSYAGNYDYYLEKIADEKLICSARPEQAGQQKLSLQESRERRNLEKKLVRSYQDCTKHMADLEQKIADIDQQMCDPDFFDQHQKIAELQVEQEKLKQELTIINLQWEQFISELEAIAYPLDELDI